MMNSGKMTTIARPYVAAAFEYALAKKALPAWEAMLLAAANLTIDPRVTVLLASPGVTTDQLGDFYCDILASYLDAEMTNFIRLLAENNRLSVLPDIAALFKEARAAQEKTMIVEVQSAAPLEEAYKQKLVTALTKRLQRQVELQCEIDPALLGGVLIRAGDTVIDGSIRGKLNRLNEFI
ncbi:MAG: F0F1 ATP synthase subunit delta [Gammaproteobacteria bacterium]|nr:F0F1 ATP synthase subunit delta [Gammaproteobacteria bacterium]